MDETRILSPLAARIGYLIGEIGYPVGCGAQPHPDTLEMFADLLRKTLDDEDPKRAAAPELYEALLACTEYMVADVLMVEDGDEFDRIHNTARAVLAKVEDTQ